jgi:hypothetical protein
MNPSLSSSQNPNLSEKAYHDALRLEREAMRASKHQRSLQRGVLILLGLLITEGLLRKMFSFLSIPLFFAKDILTLYLGLKASMGKLPKAAERILSWQVLLVILIAPNFLDTSFRDPILGVFGLKQYCLFPFVAVAVCAAYLPNHREAFRKLLAFLALSLFVTSGVAILQNKLGPGHWLNKTPAGESLAGFSAGGQLRVSSTFIFVAQYSMYLNPMVGFLTSFLILRKKPVTIFQKILPLLLLALFIVGMFITGSRSAVIGGMAITMAGLIALLFTSGASKSIRVLLFLGCAAIGYFAVHQIFPAAFAAYEARSSDSVGQSHNDEIIERVASGLFDWTGGIKTVNFLGNGIGIQSNGVDRISSYAAMMRARWGWMETDQHAVLFEGGIYLIAIWYAFRLFVICFTGFTLLGIRNSSLATCAAFCWGYVLVIGVTGTLSMQPPMSIWWWLSIGLIFCLKEFDANSPAPKTD